MADFDPDAYLAKKAAPVFNPDSYLGGGMDLARPAATPQVGPGETFLNRTVNAIPLGKATTDSATALILQAMQPGSGVSLTPEAMAELQAMGRPVPQSYQPQTLGDIYRGGRDRRIARTEAGSQQNRWAGRLGTGLGIGLSVLSPLPAFKAAKEAGMLAKMGASSLTGALYGGEAGLEHGSADLTRGDWGGGALNTGFGALLGGGLGGVLPPVAAGAGWVARKVASPLISLIRGGYVKPTPEAQRLADQGVDLTLGQMDPSSTFGRIEELAAKKVTGGSLSTARQQSAAKARDALLELAGAPGAKPPTRGAPVGQQLDELAAGFSQAYDDALGGVRLQPDQYLGAGRWRGLLTDQSVQGAAKTKGAFETAVDSVKDAAPSVRRRAMAWLEDQAKSLMPTRSGPNAGTVEAKSVQALRTQLRDKIRSLGEEGEDRQLREIYGRAEEFVSELLEGQLPPAQATALKATDAAYRNLLSAREAARRAFVQGEEFTPAQMLQAIRAKGATPELEATARDAQAVLSATYPPTGIQVAANEVAPWIRSLGPGWASIANASPGMRAHALKEVWAPGLPAAALKATGRALEGAAMSPRATSQVSRTLYDLLNPPALQDEALWVSQ